MQYEIIYDYDDGYSVSENCIEYFEGSWSDLQKHIKEMRKNGRYNITATCMRE